MKKAIFGLVMLLGCGGGAEGIGVAEQPLTTLIQHPTSDWWRPPEWDYTGGASLTMAMQELDTTWVTVPDASPLHCGSMRFAGINAVGSCQNYNSIQVIWHVEFEQFFEDIPVGIYWQQPDGSHPASLYPVATYLGSSESVERELVYNPTQDFSTSTNWTSADLGCGTIPHVGPIAGMCFAGTATLTIPVDKMWLEIRYVFGKPQG